MKLLTLIIFYVFSYYAAISQLIIDKHIIFDDTRKDLSLLYLQERYGIDKDFPDIDPKIIVVHWTGLSTLYASHRILNEPVLPDSRTDIQTGGSLNVSAHYLVDRNGEIYRMLPDTIFARHVIGLNYYAIGIENVGNDQYPLTAAQLKANVQLTKMLVMKYDIQFVIGHHEYKSFIGHPYWLEKDPAYLTEKRDPGVEFMESLRKELKGLNILGPP